MTQTHPAVEGINALTLANAIMLSSFLGQASELPMDSAAYAGKLQVLIAFSRFEKAVVKRDVTGVGSSF